LCSTHATNRGPILRKADQRMTLAQLMKTDRRPVGEVLLDAVHVSDVIMNQLRIQVEAGDVSLDTVTRLLEYSNRAGKLAKTTIDAGVAVKLVEQKERNQALEAQVVTNALVNVIDGLLDALPVDPVRRVVLKQWALSAIVANLGGEALPPVPVEYAAIEADDALAVGATPGRDRAEMDDDVRQDDIEDDQSSWLADDPDDDYSI
jgi:hypothetical protein